MKLKFKLSLRHIEHLLRVLTSVSQSYWQIGKADDKILMYFDSDHMFVYPMEHQGFDKIHARIFIATTFESGGDTYNFFESKTIESIKENNAIVFRILKFSAFIDALKILVNSEFDAQFKLAQERQPDGNRR